MRIKAFIDTNVFIYGFAHPESNSTIVLQLINGLKMEACINFVVLKEIIRYFQRYYSRELSTDFTRYLLKTCTIIHQEDYVWEQHQLKGKIKEKDIQQIAAAKALGLKYLISFDRDFRPFPEYRTPKQFLKENGIKFKETDY